MRLRFVGADDEREAAFLAALARGSATPLDHAAAPGRPLSSAEFAQAVLHFHDAPSALAQQALRGRRPDPARQIAAALKSALKFTRLPDGAERRLMLVGPPGAGKTTMIAKLAAGGRTPAPLVFTTDGDRPGGLEQLADPLSVLGIDLRRLDLAADGVPGDTGALLIDTGGTDAGFEPLGRLALKLRVEPVLVLPATVDPGEAEKFAAAAIGIGASKLLLTRLDMARRLGGPLAAASSGLALAGASVTPHFAYGLKSLDATALAAHLIDLARRHLVELPTR